MMSARLRLHWWYAITPPSSRWAIFSFS
jgi:hypothetical protein